jgi:hypothetical protein
LTTNEAELLKIPPPTEQGITFMKTLFKVTQILLLLPATVIVGSIQEAAMIAFAETFPNPGAVSISVLLFAALKILFFIVLLGGGLFLLARLIWSGVQAIIVSRLLSYATLVCSTLMLIFVTVIFVQSTIISVYFKSLVLGPTLIVALPHLYLLAKTIWGYNTPPPKKFPQ